MPGAQGSGAGGAAVDDSRSHRFVRRRGIESFPALRGISPGPRGGERHLSILDARDSHRHLARHRIRHAQRAVRASGRARAGLLRAHAHWRHHGARHQRSECRAHDAGPGRDVLVRDQPHVRALDRDHGAYGLAADAARDSARAGRERGGDSFRPHDSRPVREDPGDVFGYLQPRAGKPGRSAHGARVRAGTRGVAAVRGFEPAVHYAEHQAGAGAGHIPIAAGVSDRADFSDGAVDRRAAGGGGAHLDRQLRHVQHLHGHAGVAHDRAGLGGESDAARQRVAGPHQRDPARAAGHRGAGESENFRSPRAARSNFAA